MIETIATLVDGIFNFVIANAIPAAVAVLVVLLLQFVFRNRFSPRWRHALWYVVLIRLVVPWAPETSFSAFNAVPVLVEFDLLEAPKSYTVPIVRESSPTVEAPSHDSARNPISTWVLVWSIGVVVFCGVVAVNTLRVSVRVRRSGVADCPHVLKSFRVCRDRMGIEQRVPIVINDTSAMTAVVGLFRPRLVIPREKLDSFSTQELEHVFMHELAHIKRRDIAIAWISALIQAVYWFHPLVWLALYRMRSDREAACDALALSRMKPQSASDYGETLLKLCRRPTLSELLPNVAGIQEHRSRIKGRIQMILQFNTQSYRYTALGLVVMALAGAALLTNAKAQEAQHAQETTGTPVNEYRIDVKNMHWIEIETYLQSWSGFEEGDSITVDGLWGSIPRIEKGGTYVVRGYYTLASHDEAMIHVYATNGEVESEQGPNVAKGEGHYERKFTLTEAGMPHVNYYPADGGSGFGGTYFRERALRADDPGAKIDLAITDASLSIKLGENLKRVGMTITIANQGNVVAPQVDVYFYRGEPGQGSPITHRAGPINPGEVWNETTGTRYGWQDPLTFSAVIDPGNALPEVDETNNTIVLKLDSGEVTVSRP